MFCCVDVILISKPHIRYSFAYNCHMEEGIVIVQTTKKITLQKQKHAFKRLIMSLTIHPLLSIPTAITLV